MPSSLLRPQQLAILQLLYRFRFLNRPQIQRLLNHKHHSRMLIWLKELVSNEYIKRYYEKKITSEPAVYSIAPKGRKYLRKHRDETKARDDVLRRVWREGKFSQEFRDKCLMVAEVYISLRHQFDHPDRGLKFLTSAELRGFSHLIEPLPDAYFITREGPRKKLRPYFLDVFGEIPPRIMRSRVNKYIEYNDMEEWQENFKLPFPRIILVCPNKRLLIHLHRYIKSKMEQSYFTVDLEFYLTTNESVIISGLNLEKMQKVDNH